ncbi:MAG: D-ribitol-5-phosphate cytidylyltransferase [Thermosipho sp. (in: thermotogales)]|nr:D-ribitol-5-phosphate cytidylyltransferase [Thermosipho sp. (in: thermotogales)]
MINKMVVAVLLFGGKGERFDKNQPKQFYNLFGKTIIEHTIEKFILPNIDFILIVSNPKFLEETIKILKKYSFLKKIQVIEGGNCREESTLNAINFLKKLLNYDDIVLIHDGVRPFVSKEIILKNIKVAKEFGTAVTAIQSENTIGIVKNNKIIEFPNRENTYIIQTPQTFNFGLLVDSFEKNIEKICSFTDDSSVVKKAGYSLQIVPGSKFNIKITTKEDILISEFLLRREKDERDI